MSIRSKLGGVARRGLGHLGLDIRRVRHVPSHTLLGLRERPIRSVIDVGANVGQFARTMRRIFPDATLYCFEPLGGSFAELESWARAQPTDAVRPFRMALGDAVGTVPMHHHVEFSPASSILASTHELDEQFPKTRAKAVEEVPLSTLDAVLGELETPPVEEILLKIDTQGYEEPVLRGAARTLKRVRACIVEVTLDPLYAGQSTFEGILGELSRHGLEYRGNLEQAYAEDGHVIFLDAVFVRR